MLVLNSVLHPIYHQYQLNLNIYMLYYVNCIQLIVLIHYFLRTLTSFLTFKSQQSLYIIRCLFHKNGGKGTAFILYLQIYFLSFWAYL
jgi:hypothetical protein